MPESKRLQPVEYARMAEDIASDGLASDIVMLDIRKVSGFADYFVIMTADSSRQMRSLSEEIEQGLEKGGATRHHREGTHDSGWMLLDFGDVIVHVFGPEQREFYEIERFWSSATLVSRHLQ